MPLTRNNSGPLLSRVSGIPGEGAIIEP
jgi:hypothetical protein